MEYLDKFNYLTLSQKQYLEPIIEQNQLQINKEALKICKENEFNFEVISLIVYSMLEDEVVKSLNLNERELHLIKNISSITELDIVIDKENHFEDYRNLIVLLAEDYIVLICILVLRLTLMKDQKKLSFVGKREYGEKTLHIFSPIAHRLGLGKIKSELEELSLYYIDYVNYKKVANLLEVKRTKREQNLQYILEDIDSKLKLKIANYVIKGRNKSIYSIYKKTININRTFDEIYDFQGIRIICKTKEDCYTVLGVIHENYNPIPGRFKDYIALKKPNLYQSLHTSVCNAKGEIFEVQIRTYEMDEIAERGVAAHWVYKNNGVVSLHDVEEQLHLFRDLINHNEENIVKNLNKEVFESTIYVFTPANKIIMLPTGATIIDFAYKIHTKVGNSIQMAIVNEKIVTFDTELKNGDKVKVITKDEENAPKKEWLEFVRTSHAKKKIKSFLNNENKKEKEILIEKGRIKVERLIKSNTLKYDLLNDIKLQNEILKKLNIRSIDDFCKEVLSNNFLISQVNKVKFDDEDNLKVRKIKNKHKDIIIPGIDNLKMQFAKCCMPVYGDEIIGKIRTGQYISIHKKSCKAVDDNQYIEVFWAEENIEKYISTIIIIAVNRNSLLNDIINVLSKHKVSLGNAKSIIKDELVKTEIEVYVRNLDELNIIINSLKNVDTIESVKRKTK